MAKVFSPNIIEVAIKADLAGYPHVNVLHFWNDEAGGADNVKVEDVRNNWQDHIVPLLANNYVLQEFEWRSLDRDDNNVGTVIPDPAKATAGASASEMLPGSIAYLIHKNTDNRPRGRRDGRMYLGGVLEANVGEGATIDGATVTAWNTALAAFLDGVNDTGVSAGESYLAVMETTPLSRAKGTQEVDIGSRKVTSLTLDPKVAHMTARIGR